VIKLTETYTKNKILKLDSTVTLQENITVDIYEWTINNNINPNNTSSISINTNDLNLGDNTISLRVKNSCGSWSEYVTKTINIINEVNMEQTFTVVVDKPVTNVEVVMNLTGTVIITVKNPLGVVIPNATVKIDTVSAITNSSGVATLNEISYGTKIITVTIT